MIHQGHRAGFEPELAQERVFDLDLEIDDGIANRVNIARRKQGKPPHAWGSTSSLPEEQRGHA